MGRDRQPWGHSRSNRCPRATGCPTQGISRRSGPLVRRLLARYDFAPIEGLLVEAAHAADALATVRAAEQPDIITTRLEMQLSRHFTALLAQLHVETPA